jgi:2,4-dienoyl-CoA reductase-like NADH-dependent reductase (Old Yellow Enzyme family)
MMEAPAKNTQTLFTRYRLNGLQLPNRVVMAPMTRSFSPNGVPGSEVAAYYRRRAAGGVGLIITEGAGIARPAALDDPNAPRLHGQLALDGWKNVIDAVHEAGGRIAPQLWHVGQKQSRANAGAASGTEYESPSGLSATGELVARPMTRGDISATVSAFAQAACTAEKSGFDGIELHGANGYLIDQFFSPEINKRTDGYGGESLLERSQFAIDVLRAVRTAVSSRFPVILRLSLMRANGQGTRLVSNPKELEQWLQVLTAAGADAFHIAQAKFWEPAFPDADSRLSLAGWVKRLTGITSIAVGSVGLDKDVYQSFAGAVAKAAPIDELMSRMAADEFDLVAIGRALLQDPTSLEKVRLGQASLMTDVAPSAFSRLF